MACAAPLDTLGHHASCCPAINKSVRHTIVGLVKAPTVATYHPQKPTAVGDDANDTLSKGDIGLALKTHRPRRSPS